MRSRLVIHPVAMRLSTAPSGRDGMRGFTLNDRDRAQIEVVITERLIDPVALRQFGVMSIHSISSNCAFPTISSLCSRER